MELLLKKNEILDLGETLTGHTVICLAGRCWLTQTGDSRDHFLHPGGPFTITRKGQLVITAMVDCRIKLVAEPKAINASSPWLPHVCSN